MSLNQTLLAALAAATILLAAGLILTLSGHDGTALFGAAISIALAVGGVKVAQKVKGQ